MALSTGHTLPFGIDEVVTRRCYGQNLVLANVGLQVNEPLVVLVVGHGHQPLIICQCFYLVEVVAAAVVGSDVITQDFHHHQPSVDSLLQCRAVRWVFRVGKYLA